MIRIRELPQIPIYFWTGYDYISNVDLVLTCFLNKLQKISQKALPTLATLVAYLIERCIRRAIVALSRRFSLEAIESADSRWQRFTAEWE